VPKLVELICGDEREQVFAEETRTFPPLAYSLYLIGPQGTPLVKQAITPAQTEDSRYVLESILDAWGRRRSETYDTAEYLQIGLELRQLEEEFEPDS
jgi:hypothetical protein